MSNHSFDGSAWRWWVAFGFVAYIALIGIFAIEELNGRDETLRVLLAEEARLDVWGRIPLLTVTRHEADPFQSRDACAA